MRICFFVLSVLLAGCVATTNYFSFQFGDFQLIAINDLSGTGVLSEIFVEGALGPPVDPSMLIPELERVGYPINAAKTGFICPIMTVYGKNSDGTQFIIDTGLGPKISGGKSMLKSTLDSLGVDRNEIDYVILTHAHPDHAGGLLDTDGSMIFPNATLVLGSDEYALWTSANPNWGDFCCPKILDQLLPIVQANLKAFQGPQLQLISSNIELLPGMNLIITGGHTSDDADIYVQFDGIGSEKFYVLGDSAFSPLHYENTNYACTHDHHQQESIDRRSSLVGSIFQSSDLLLGMHFAFPGLGSFDISTKTFTYFNGSMLVN